MASANVNKGLVGLLRRGWDEIPEVMASSVVGLIGIGLLISSVKLYYSKDGDIRKYRKNYTVYRHDDPRVARLKYYNEHQKN